MAREEYEFWSGPYGNRELTPAIVDPDELRVVRDLDREQRVHFIEGEEELFPGAVATRLGGHTPGQLMVAVRGGGAALPGPHRARPALTGRGRATLS